MRRQILVVSIRIRPGIASHGIVSSGDHVDRVAETSQVDDVRVGRIDLNVRYRFALAQQRDRVIAGCVTSLVGMAWWKLACRRQSRDD